MPGLTIVVAAADAERFHAALSLAAANAALGQESRLFLQGGAAALLRDVAAPSDDRRAAHGIPTVAQLIGEAQALGVEIIACQSGLALTGLSADQLPPGVTTGGLIQILTTQGDAQLVMA